MLDGSTWVYPANDWIKVGMGTVTGYQGMVDSKNNGNTGFGLVYYSDSVEVCFFKTWTKIFDSFEEDIWHDYMWHVNWQTDTTGFIELFHRVQGETIYEKVWSRYDVQTEWDDFTDRLPGPNFIQTRSGGYRPSSSNTMYFYIMDL